MSFLESESEKSDGEDSLVVNAAYAASHEKRKRKQELARLAELSESEESSDDESEDESAELLSTAVETQILRTINKIKSKDPAIYDKGTRFFEAPASEEEGSDDEGDAQTAKKHKPVKYKDVIRGQIMEAEDAEDVISSDEEGGKKVVEARKASTLGYDQQQREIRQTLLDQLGDESGSDSDGEEFLQVQVKSKEQEEADAKEYQAELAKLEKAGGLGPKENDEGSRFLHDFIASKRWKEPVTKFAVEEEKDGMGVADSEDEEELDKQDAFEAKYNFRFEEEGGTELMSFSRHQRESVRRDSDKRKKDREARRLRKLEERKHKEEELRHLKNLKRAEIQEKLEKIKALSGGALVDEEDLEADFDPDTWDKQMANTFGEAYYEAKEEEDGWKPGDDPLKGIDGLEEDEQEQEQDWDGEEEGEGAGGGDEDDEEMGECDPGDDNEELEEAKRAKNKLLDELYELDYEDIIGDIPCRFRYREVTPNNFGLSTEDVLLADDKDLQRYVSLKKVAPYSDHDPAVDSKKRKKLKERLAEREKELEAEMEAAAKKKRKRRGKRKSASGAAAGDAEAEAAAATVEGGAEARESSTGAAGGNEKAPEESYGGKKRKRRKRKKAVGDESEMVPQVQAGASLAVGKAVSKPKLSGKKAGPESKKGGNDGAEAEKTETKAKKKKKKKTTKGEKQKGAKNAVSVPGVSDDRLASYGL
ncbi:unnamed protein product [Chrysoparadoxa australica]